VKYDVATCCYGIDCRKVMSVGGEVDSFGGISQLRKGCGHETLDD